MRTAEISSANRINKAGCFPNQGRQLIVPFRFKMSNLEIDRLRRIVEEQQRRLEEAEQRSEEERRRRQEAEERTSKTTLPALLDGLHAHLSLGLEVQRDSTQSTRGDPSNATNKLRPDKIRVWEQFATDQEAIWQLLMDSDLINERHFTSLHTLQEEGEAVRRRLISSELDLNHFLRLTVEDHVSRIIEIIYQNSELREAFGLKGSIRFENHANTLSPERQIENAMDSMDIRGRAPPRRRSPRLLAREQHDGLVESNTPVKTSTIRGGRPRADQFCVYNITRGASETDYRVPAYIKEFKAPHKLKLGFINEGLQDMDLELVVQYNEAESAQDRFKRLIAAVITQAFDYAVDARVKYAMISTGEADIYLKIDDDPSTVYYYLSVPKADVGETTAWDPNTDSPNRLHLTAVGQLLAFTLQAIKTPLWSHEWRQRAHDTLAKWEVMYMDMLDKVQDDDEPPGSEYRPRPNANDFIRISPIRIRRRRLPINYGGCQPPPEQPQPDDDDDEFDSDTPSRTRQATDLLSRSHPASLKAMSTPSPSGPDNQQRQNNRRYCTVKCLRGLIDSGPLDPACPNVRDHGKHSHSIDQSQLLSLLSQQLSESLAVDCETLGIHGSRGVLLKVTLSSFGYTMPAKCTIPEFVHHLKHEATVYQQLLPVQGIHVPLYLGSLDLDPPCNYDGIADLVHMMLLGPGGQPIARVLNTANRQDLIEKTKQSLVAIHRLGVEHRDAEPRNLLWNPEIKTVVLIDFERAQIHEPRPVLGVLSPNPKRKRTPSLGLCKPLPERRFATDINLAVNELRDLNKWDGRKVLGEI
ncbi:hypothetical protein, variant [Blastomyces gilchristii SLH14081]|uniref:Protein kinase domain-containing protein n=1 Tax=Blastomyces gilchristii (strain SLH14081) TaxID=559298 RepID=A0A179UT08_BLAGS|nr:uncharacterized protein BDBG_06215 [Blastomyces gilchristii SLH14081]XP_031579300.1 hypothetical protein, variant [Blastomyces gilchristii SLH14081]OAT10369.1 hypothetical protein BDBG_06215 [Blastomyces gilchristii SLH14081]OAT10370.1 hypothetical protein, variant [Blastomyces gilchristii SLH14081]